MAGVVLAVAVVLFVAVGCGRSPAAATELLPAALTGATIQDLMPPGATLVREATLPLTAPGARDGVAVYATGPLRDPAVKDCAGTPPGCHLLVAVPAADGRLRALWQWGPAGYAPLGLLAAQSLTGGAVPELVVSFPASATFASIRVVSFAGGQADPLLAADGGSPQVMAPETPGSLPGLAFRHHDTGGSGTRVVWRWDAALHRMERADGALASFYRQQAKLVPLTPTGAAWADRPITGGPRRPCRRRPSCICRLGRMPRHCSWRSRAWAVSAT